MNALHKHKLLQYPDMILRPGRSSRPVLKLLMLAAMLAMGLNGLAQQEDLKILRADSTEFLEKSIIEQENEDSLTAEHIYVDRHPTDTEIGTFQIRSSNENFLLRIGGFAKLVGYEDVGLENELFFDLYKIATVDDRPLGRFNMHAFESRLNMEVFGKTSLGLFRVFIEGDFLKDNNGGLRLRHAVGQFRGFTFGHTWTYFMDLNATPTSIDLYGTNATTFARKALIGFKYLKDDEFEIGVSVENPASKLFRNQNTVRPQLYPDLVGKFTKIWGPSHLQVAGIFRTFLFINSLSGEEKFTYGYGAYLSGGARISQKLKFYTQAVFGDGIADYIALDPVLVEEGNGDYSTVRTFSGVAGINYIISYRSQLNAFGSYVRLFDTSDMEEGHFMEGMQLNANYLFNILPSLKTGLEFIYGQSTSIIGATGNAARIYGMFQFDF